MRLLLDRGGLTAARFHQVLEHSLEPHQRSGEPFYHIAKLILEYGFNLNELRPDQGRTLLHGASSRGSVNAVSWLLQNGADPNALDEEGRTPLHVCAARNTVATVVKLLIGAGSEPNALDASGNTPLDYARKNGRSRVADYLVSVVGQSSGRGLS
jgi:ankyrin repeat protein